MDLRAFVVLSLLTCLLAPAFDHHAAERDPWHGHLVRHGSQSLVHLHSYDRLHAHPEAPEQGAILITEGSGGAPPSVSLAGPTFLAPEPSGVPAPSLVVLLIADLSPVSGVILSGADPPPRPVL